jgi:hypothetical protein
MRSGLLCASVLHIFALSAFAGTLTTGSLSAPADHLAACEVTNVGTRPIAVTIRMFDGGPGAEIGSEAFAALEAGHTVDFKRIGGVFRCAFDIAGKSTSVRADAKVYRISDLLSVAVYPAR